MGEYSKSLACALPGLILVLAGAALSNETVITIGASLLGVSPLVWRVPNRKRVPRRKHVRKGIPTRR